MAFFRFVLSTMAISERYGGTIYLTVHVTVSPRVVGLTWSTTKHRQEGVFTVSATAEEPVPPGYTETYAWTGDGLEFDNAAAASTTARAINGPSEYYPTCTISYIKAGSTLYGNGGDALSCFAIGDPITLSIPVDTTITPTFKHDLNLLDKPYFLTYYGYPHSKALPMYAQKTQNALAKLVLAQPVGTTVTWNALPSSVYSSMLLSDPHALSIDLAAEAASKGIPITATFDFIDPQDQNVTGTAQDDSSSTQFLLARKWVAWVNTVSGHAPASFSSPPITQDYVPSHGDTQDYAGKTYEYRVLDSNQEVMPGVWIQERFTDNSLGLTVNGIDFYWQTALSSTMDGSGLHPQDGWMAAADYLWYVWVQGDRRTKTAVHEYWGGTKSNIIGDSGCRIGSYTITFMPGQPGTASQIGP